MSKNNLFIKVLYGPYEANGVIRHKIQKIYGLIKFLETENYKYATQPSPYFNRLTLEMNDRVIYTCDIRFMKFNTPFDENDILCNRIIDVIELHQMTFSQAGNVPKFPNISEGMRMQLRHDSSVSLTDESSDLYSTQEELLRASWEEQDGDEAWSMNIIDALRNWDKDAFMNQYVFDYGCFIQTPQESEPSEPLVPESKDTTTSTSSPVTSCICLSVDPPSLYSVCYGPPTPLNTEVSKKMTDTEGSKNLNEEADIAFSREDWKELFATMAPNPDDTDAFDSFFTPTTTKIDLDIPKEASPSKSKSSMDHIIRDFLKDMDDDQDEGSLHSDSLYGMEPSLGVKLETDDLEDDKALEATLRSKICEAYTGGGKCPRKCAPLKHLKK